MRCSIIRTDIHVCSISQGLHFALLLCCFVTTLLCATLRYTALHCATLRYTALHCATLRYTALHCATLRYTSLLCATLRSSALLKCSCILNISFTSVKITKQRARMEVDRLFKVPIWLPAKHSKTYVLSGGI
jgi:hypothetical protein